VRDSVIGSLAFGARAWARFSEDDLAVIQIVAGQVATALERTRAREELLQGERDYRELVESANSIILKFDREGRIQFFNETGCRFFGYRREEVMGRDVRILLPQVESTGRVLENLIDELQEDPESYSESINENVRKNGDRVWVSWRNRPIRDASGRVIGNLAVGQDMTERRSVEDRLRESEARFRAVFELAAVGMAQVDIDTGRFRIVNDRLAQIAGRSPEELLKLTFSDITHPDDQAQDAEMFRRLMDGVQNEYRSEKRYVRPDGRLVWVQTAVTLVRDSEGRPLYSVGIVQDVTESKQAEQALLDAARELETRNRILRALSDSNQVLMRAVDEAGLLNDVCRIIVEDCGYPMVWIGYAEKDAEKSVRPVSFSGFDEGYLETLRLTWAESERGLGPTGKCIRTMTPCMCRNMLSDPQFAPWREEALKRGFASSIAIPLVADGEAIGALTIYAKEADPFSSDEVKLLTELAGDLSHGISTIRVRAAHARAEEAVRSSEERYRRFFEDDLTGDFIATPEGRILFCNPAFVRLFRFEGRDQAVGSSLADLHPQEASWKEFVALIRRHRVIEQYECERRRRDGTVVHIVENVIGTFDDEGHLTQVKGYVYDDSERKEAEFALKEANRQLREQAEEFVAINEELQAQTEELQAQTEELRVANEELRAGESRLEAARAEIEHEKRRLEAVMEALPVGVAITDTEGGIIRSNAAFKEVWGGPPPRTVSVGDYGFYRAWWAKTDEPIDPSEWAAARTLREGRGVTGQLLKIRKFDSSEGFVINSASPIHDPTGRISGSAVAIQDITDLRRAEDALRRLNDELERRVSERTETLAQTVQKLEDEVLRRIGAEEQLQERSRLLEGFFRCTIAPLAFMDREFNFIRVNEAYARLYGRIPEDFESWNYFALDPEADSRDAFEHVVRTKEQYHAFARPLSDPRRPDRLTYWNCRLIPVLDDERAVLFLVLNLEDVTDRQQAFAELQERARQLQRLTLELSQAEDRERRRLAQLLHDDLQQLLVGARLHLDFLARKGRSAGHEPNEVLDRARGLLVEAIEKSRGLSHELSPPFVTQGTLREGLLWLSKHMQNTCGLEVSVQVQAGADLDSETLRSFVYKATQEMLFNVIKHARVRRAHVRVRRSNGFIKLLVADDGSGFERRRLRRGEGLGLFSIQERAALLGGWMRFRSAAGRGSVFLLAVPAEHHDESSV
ncbi:MAG: PAS domain S-box protein, partial [Acidobacteriota bacterium]